MHDPPSAEAVDGEPDGEAGKGQALDQGVGKAGAQGGELAEKAAITGALSLYLNFINLFTLLLQLLGQRD